MQLDLATTVPLLLSVLGTLGIASIISQWFAAGKDRRTARAAVLTELGSVESRRWATVNDDLDEQFVGLRTAIRQLQTAALLARVPPGPVLLYSQLALASFWQTREEVERDNEPEEIGLPLAFSDFVHDGAEMVSRAAWASPAVRWVWIRWRHYRLGRRLREPGNENLAELVDRARRFVR